MGARVKITLSDEDFATLRMWVNSGKTEQRLALRAQVVLASAEGLSLKEIEQRTGLNWKSCLKWRKRFINHGFEGLQDAKGRGRPQGISPEERGKIIALACTTPVDGSTRWSVRKLAEATGHSKSAIQTILSEGAIKPHKTTYWCGKSPDPEFEEKQAAIIGLYLSPPENAVILCVDEKSQIQALDRTQKVEPMQAGENKRMTSTYKRNGTTCLLASFCVHEGTIDGRCIDKNNHEEFLRYLKFLYRKFPNKELHIIMDNLSVHKHKTVTEWVSKRKRMRVYFTPTYSSWLNQVEIWFNIFTRDVLRDGIWKSKEQLVNQIMTYIRNYNKLWGKPFKWTYTGKPLTK